MFNQDFYLPLYCTFLYDLKICVHLHPLQECVFTSVYSIPILRAKKCFNLFFCNNLQRKNKNLPEKKNHLLSVLYLKKLSMYVRYTMKPCRLTTEMSRFILESLELWRRLTLETRRITKTCAVKAHPGDMELQFLFYSYLHYKKLSQSYLEMLPSSESLVELNQSHFCDNMPRPIAMQIYNRRDVKLL